MKRNTFITLAGILVIVFTFTAQPSLAGPTMDSGTQMGITSSPSLPSSNTPTDTSSGEEGIPPGDSPTPMGLLPDPTEGGVVIIPLTGSAGTMSSGSGASQSIHITYGGVHGKSGSMFAAKAAFSVAYFEGGTLKHITSWIVHGPAWATDKVDAANAVAQVAGNDAGGVLRELTPLVFGPAWASLDLSAAIQATKEGMVTAVLNTPYP